MPISSTNLSAHRSPNIFRCFTLEKWIMYCLLFTEPTFSIPYQICSGYIIFVAIALCQVGRGHTLIFRGILAFQICLKGLSIPLVQRWLYMDLAVNCPDLVHFPQRFILFIILGLWFFILDHPHMLCKTLIYNNHLLKLNCHLLLDIVEIVSFCSLKIPKRFRNLSLEGL